MKVSVDPKLCMGHGLCYGSAPQLFVDDEQGYSHVIGDGTVPEGEEEAARHAVANCPEGAITLEE
ncbi:ferredoxin [Mycolicibacter senuensis]|uniref:ferredoxin n=1 Tax=Mycolicibacter senuensis TaxID=386913 RepID=UPI000DCDB71A|nr:ferredoxin [Mycolicibacter senuensis]RAU95585.1 ferredoxin [Mycolicibacter senuensis]